MANGNLYLRLLCSDLLRVNQPRYHFKNAGVLDTARQSKFSQAKGKA